MWLVQWEPGPSPGLQRSGRGLDPRPAPDLAPGFRMSRAAGRPTSTVVFALKTRYGNFTFTATATATATATNNDANGNLRCVRSFTEYIILIPAVLDPFRTKHLQN